MKKLLVLVVVVVVLSMMMSSCDGYFNSQMISTKVRGEMELKKLEIEEKVIIEKSKERTVMLISDEDTLTYTTSSDTIVIRR